MGLSDLWVDQRWGSKGSCRSDSFWAEIWHRSLQENLKFVRMFFAHGEGDLLALRMLVHKCCLLITELFFFPCRFCQYSDMISWISEGNAPLWVEIKQNCHLIISIHLYFYQQSNIKILSLSQISTSFKWTSRQHTVSLLWIMQYYEIH